MSFSLKREDIDEFIYLKKALATSHCRNHICPTKPAIRSYSNGSKHLVEQCTRCGTQIGTPKKINNISLTHIPNFDELSYQNNYAVSHENELNYRMNKYIERIGDRNFKLLIKSCESPDSKQEKNEFWESEKTLANWLQEYLRIDFYVFPEVTGYHLPSKKAVRIDLLVQPKPDLVNRGFPNKFWGIEVKKFTRENFFSEGSRACAQAMSYNESVFQVGTKSVATHCCIIFSNLSFRGKNFRKNALSELGNLNRSAWNCFLHVGNHRRIGEMVLFGTSTVDRGLGN